MPGVLGAASIPFIACVTLLVAMILQIVSFAAPFWAYEEGKGDFGLWRRTKCLPLSDGTITGCYRNDHMWYFLGDWFDAVRACECLTLFFWAVPLVVLPVYIYVSMGLYYRAMMGTMTLFTLLGAIWCFIGFVIFGAKYNDEFTDKWTLGWCFILCIIGDAIGILAFLVLLCATVKRPKFMTESHFVSGFYADPYQNKLYVVETIEPINGIIDIGHVNPTIVVDE